MRFVQSRLDTMLAKLLILAVAASCCYGFGTSFIGGCKTPKTPADFDLEKFAGTWHEVESSPSVDKIVRKCSTYKIEFKARNKASLLHKYHSKLLGKIKSEFSEITTVKSSEPAKLSVTPVKSSSMLDTKWPLWIVDTDYNSYAVGYSCTKKIVSRSEQVFIFSRTKTIDDKKRMDIYDIVKKNDLPAKNLVEVPQDDKECSGDE